MKKDNKKVLLSSTEEGKIVCRMQLEESKMKCQEELRKFTDDESCFKDNKSKVFNLTLNKHCARAMKNGIKELTDC